MNPAPIHSPSALLFLLPNFQVWKLFFLIYTQNLKSKHVCDMDLICFMLALLFSYCLFLLCLLSSYFLFSLLLYKIVKEQATDCYTGTNEVVVQVSHRSPHMLSWIPKLREEESVQRRRWKATFPVSGSQCISG